jgi:DNA topoisomerase-1
MKNLVIVESPAKAKTIEKYLGKDFTVKSSVGHIRKDTKVDVANNFAVTYEITDDHKKIVADLKKAAEKASMIWLATDEDREGESISWHLLEILKLPKTTNRITFHEITKPALEEAIKKPRHVDMDMVASQQARQTLDMLVGFDLSGVVRRKVPGAISAGRVQSPALRLIVERERDIEKFAAKSTFKTTADFGDFSAALDKTFDTEKAATDFLNSLTDPNFPLKDLKTADALKNPPVPLTTATLQIEANQRLGFSAGTTMRAAQALYQSGAITYHRTDSLNLSGQALASMSNYIKSTYGDQYSKTRNFKTKSASAQEAHEAIRPTHVEQEAAGNNDFEHRLYHLIRTRTLATQMAPAKVAKTDAIFTIPDHKEQFIAKGEIILFDGFLRVYGKSKETTLPPLEIGKTYTPEEITSRQVFANPPARYTEGSLVKKLEELGIGRPSTYAGIIYAIQSRGYVIKGASDGTEREVVELKLAKSQLSRALAKEKTGADKNKLLPTPVGELVSDFLTKYFENIVDYGFTAGIEKELDAIADAKLEKVKMLRDFYTPFSKTVGASGDAERFNNARELGKDPKTNKTIYAKVGRSGEFIQLGENEKESGEKPRFAPMPKNTTIKTLTFEQALAQLALPALPRNLGKAEDGAEIVAASGPFGPYLKAGKYNIPLKADPYTIGLGEALELYEAKKASILADWGDILIINGAYGPYIKGPGRRNNVKLPKDTDPKKITKEQAEKMLAEKPKSPRRTPVRRRKSAQVKSPKKH